MRVSRPDGPCVPPRPPRLLARSPPWHARRAGRQQRRRRSGPPGLHQRPQQQPAQRARPGVEGPASRAGTSRRRCACAQRARVARQQPQRVAALAPRCAARAALVCAPLPGLRPHPPHPTPTLPAAVLVGATSDSDTDVTRSMHSLIIMQEQADSPRSEHSFRLPPLPSSDCLLRLLSLLACLPSRTLRSPPLSAVPPLFSVPIPAPTVESRSPSFLSKGLAGWKSFTARRPSEPQLAPALHPGQTQQPPSSAQITPRVQPSMMPTPRLGLAAAPPPPVLAAASSKQLHLQSAGSGFAMALRAAAEVSAAADVVAAADGAPPSPAAAAAAARAPLADAVAPGAAAAAQKKEGEQEEGEDDQGGITWRSDAVQLPEQLLLPDGTPASPTGTDGADAAGAVVTARTRGRCVQRRAAARRGRGLHAAPPAAGICP